jgi:hypothetical protein
VYRRVVGFPGDFSRGITPSSFPRSGASNEARAVQSILTERLGVLDQRLEGLGLAVCEETRIVELAERTVGSGPLPGAAIAVDPAGVGLELDEVDAVVGDSERIDFVDLAVVGSELEVRPHVIRLAVGQPLAKPGKSLALVVVGGIGDGDPPCRIHPH